MFCTYCKIKKVNCYLVPPGENIYGKWSVMANHCGECIPDFQVARLNMIKVRNELLKKIKCY